MTQEYRELRDLLIKVDTTLTMLVDEFRKHERVDDKFHATLEKDIKDAHRRMDWLTTAGIMSVVILGITMWFK